ncbi:uncharacterized protein LOC142572927 isoform X2 [Dermacentor variabilis]|uniref:uncharacterized protein LOC142572927 isoform X2 n=1 Tax=Dermacentor variabilis TaxID=34621 RepID=UPI003F5B1A99
MERKRGSRSWPRSSALPREHARALDARETHELESRFHAQSFGRHTETTVEATSLPSQVGTIYPADSLNGGVLAFVVPGGKLPQDDPGTLLKAAPFRYCSRLSRGFSLNQARQVLQHFICDRERCWFISVPSAISTQHWLETTT